MWTAKLTIAYDGTNYVGWQVQPNGRSIQASLESAWKEVTGEQVRLTASGRTDAGVHAVGQVVSVRTETGRSLSTLNRALQALTPYDISIISVQRARDDFHAIRDAVEKTYRYRIQFDSPRSPLELRYAWYVHQSLDLSAMQEAASRLQGQHDFASFQAAGSPRNSTVRVLSQLGLDEADDGPFRYLSIYLSADGFLYNMARNLVGTLVEVGRGRAKPDWIDEVLAAQDRRAAALTAPAHGLCLLRVTYPPGHLNGQAN